MAMLSACAYAQRPALLPDPLPAQPERPSALLSAPYTQTEQSRASSSWSRAALSLLAVRRRRTYLL